jgi:hypothetical protein
MNFIWSFLFLTKIVSCEHERRFISFVDWNDMNNEYKHYEKGFPKHMTWSQLSGIHSPVSSKCKIIKKTLTDHYFKELGENVDEVIQLELNHRLNLSVSVCKFSAADFLCIFAKDELYFCEWQHFRHLYSWEPYLFKNQDHVSIMYIFAACSMHKFKDNKKKHDNDIRFNTELCPNPCKSDDFNPCAFIRNTYSDICVVVNEEMMIYEDNFKCLCKHQYEWDPNSLDCKLKNLCENNRYCGGFERSYRCDMYLRSSDFHGLGFNDYEVVCNCTSQYMGLKCEKIRDPCFENNKGESVSI